MLRTEEGHDVLLLETCEGQVWSSGRPILQMIGGLSLDSHGSDVLTTF